MTAAGATTTAPVAVARTRPRRPGRGVRARESASAYLLIAPNVVLLALFVLVPLVRAVWLGFRSTDGFGAGRWVGLDNYTRLFTDERFWRATGNTILFTAIVTPLSMAIGLAMAMLLNEALPARPLFRSLLILPMAVSGIATALLGGLIFDENTGLLNALISSIGLPAVDWQSGGTAAFASVTLTTLWWRVGFNMLIYLAGLQGIGPHLLEAARLDGASAWQRFRLVTVPLLGPSSFFLLVMNVIYSFQVFDIVFVLTGGGPQDATSVLVTYAYDNAFVTRDQGYAAAIGMVLLVLTGLFTAVRWKLSRTREVGE